MIPTLLLAAALLSTPSTAERTPQALLTVRATPFSGGAAARGEQRVPVLVLQFSASCAQGMTLRSVTVHHTGRGDRQDIAALYASSGSLRLTNAAMLSHNDTAVLRFRSLHIAPCGVRTVTVMMDVSPDAASGGEHSFSLNAEGDVSADAPVRLSSMPSLKPVSVSPAQASALSVSYRPLSQPPSYGEDWVLSRILLSNTGDSDVLIRSLTFTNDGSARDGDLQGLWIGTERGERLSGILPSLDGDTLPFALRPPFLLPRHHDQLLLVHGDVRASRRRTIRLLIAEPSDIDAFDVRGRTKQ